MHVAHFSTICSSRIAEIHVCSAILNKQITKSMQHFFTYSVNLKQDLLFFLIIIISLRSGWLIAIHTNRKH